MLRVSEETDGHAYFTETDYEVFNIFPGMCPAQIRVVGLLKGIKTPDFEQEFHFLDLGCGQGFALNAYAAVYPRGHFVGLDMAEGAIAGARALARDAGLKNVRFEAATFADFAARTNQKYDVITLHGIWTWVGAEVREDALAILSNHLKPGGVVYISGNSAFGRDQAKPAHAILLAMRREKPDEEVLDLMKRFGQVLTDNPMLLGHAHRAASFIEYLVNGNANFFAHEFLSSAWSPVAFSDLAADMARAGLTFFGSAHPASLFPGRFFIEPHRSFVEGFQNPLDRETAYDALMATEFRADLFVKDPEPLSAEEQRQMLLATPLIVKNRSRLQLDKKVTGEVADISATKVFEAVCAQLLYGPCTLGEAASKHNLDNVDTKEFSDTVLLLLMMGAVTAGIGNVHDPETTARAQRFNQAAFQIHARLSGTTPLISPQSRSPVSLSIIDSIAIRAERDGIDPVATLLNVAGTNKVIVRVDGQAVEDIAAVTKSYQRTFAVWPLVRRPALVSVGVLA